MAAVPHLGEQRPAKTRAQNERGMKSAAFPCYRYRGPLDLLEILIDHPHRNTATRARLAQAFGRWGATCGFASGSYRRMPKLPRLLESTREGRSRRLHTFDKAREPVVGWERWEFDAWPLLRGSSRR